MKHNLSQNESEIITMFGFEWNKEEERQALIECGETRGKISTIRELLAEGLITLDALKATGRYSPEELDAIAKM